MEVVVVVVAVELVVAVEVVIVVIIMSSKITFMPLRSLGLPHNMRPNS